MRSSEKLLGDTPSQAQKIGPFNDPNSISGQLADTGHAILNAAGIQPFGPEDPNEYQTLDAKKIGITGAPRFQTSAKNNGLIPGIFPDLPAETPASSALIKSGAELLDDLKPLPNGAIYLDHAGNALKVAGNDHAAALVDAALSTPEASYDPRKLADMKLIRIRNAPGGMAVQVNHQPTEAQSAMLESMIGKSPAQTAYDFLSARAKVPMRLQGNVDDSGEFMKILSKMKWK